MPGLEWLTGLHVLKQLLIGKAHVLEETEEIGKNPANIQTTEINNNSSRGYGMEG